MRHSQCIFRLFLGVSDIIVGLIILPTTVNKILKTFRSPLQLQTPIHVIGQKNICSTNGNYIYTNATTILNMLETTRMVENRIFPLVYKNTIGYFTNMCIIVSIYLLTVSGIDRLRALLMPLHYNQIVAKRFAWLSTIFCFCLAILISIVPIFLNNINYTITVMSFINIVGDEAVSFYIIEFIFPLLATWIISALTYLTARKTFARNISSATDEDNLKQQRRLNFVLILMLVMFSFSLLPCALALLIILIVPGTDVRSLKNYNSIHNMVAYSLVSTAIIIMPTSCLWNCIIYSLRTKTFRKVAKEKYKNIWNNISCIKLFSE